MKCIRIIILLVVIVLGLYHIIPAQTITQEEFLGKLRRTHPLFQKEELTIEIEKEDKNSCLGSRDWTLLSSVTLIHEKQAIASMGPERTDAISISTGVEKLFWKTGGQLSTSLTLGGNDLKVNPMFGTPDSYFKNQFDITYVHPLIQNKGGFLNKFSYNIEQYDIDYSEIQAFENKEEFLAGSAAVFLDWVFLTEQKEIVIERMSLSEEALNNILEKREANLIDEIDVLRARDAVSITRQNLVLVESQWKALQAKLAVLIQDDRFLKYSPQFNLYKIEPLKSLDEAKEQLMRESRLLQTLNIRIRQLGFSRLGYEETTKAQLSLVAQLNLKSAEEKFGKSLVLDKPDALIGLQFSKSLGNRTAKSKVVKTNLEIMHLESQKDEITLELVSALTDLHIRISEMEKVLILNREQIESSRKKTEEELKLYNQGRGDLTFVIQSQDGEQNAKLTYAINALTYHKLFIQYRALMDQLL